MLRKSFSDSSGESVSHLPVTLASKIVFLLFLITICLEFCCVSGPLGRVSFGGDTVGFRSGSNSCWLYHVSHVAYLL